MKVVRKRRVSKERCRVSVLSQLNSVTQTPVVFAIHVFFEQVMDKAKIKFQNGLESRALFEITQQLFLSVETCIWWLNRVFELASVNSFVLKHNNICLYSLRKPLRLSTIVTHSLPTDGNTIVMGRFRGIPSVVTRHRQDPDTRLMLNLKYFSSIIKILHLK